MADEESGADQRKHTRLLIDVSAEIVFDDGVTVEGRTKDMSFGGVFLVSPGEPVPAEREGGECRLRLNLGEEDEDPVHIEIQGMVVRCTGRGVGVQFRSTTIEGYWHFKNLMVYNSPEAEWLLEELEEHPGLSIH